MSGLKERADRYDKGLKSKYFKIIAALTPPISISGLIDEQIAIMALIVEKYFEDIILPDYLQEKIIRNYSSEVIKFQRLMSSGRVRSSQIFVEIFLRILASDPE